MNDRVVGIILKEKSILLFWRYSKGKEYYIFPGGTIEKDEKLETALRREIYEELNLDIKINKKMFSFFNDELHPRNDHFYLITDFAGIIKLGAPELTHQHQDNIFRPEWVHINVLNELPLVPLEGKKKVIEFLKNLT